MLNLFQHLLKYFTDWIIDPEIPVQLAGRKSDIVSASLNCKLLN